VTLHGSGWAVMTTSGLATTPHGGAAGPVVVELPGDVVVGGLPVGGTPVEPHAVIRAATATEASTQEGPLGAP
ncbi:MAG TPA: hypothetical protein VMV22_08715, partial [Acidimicrobiales bacterium]|nr:hypothetical protein [Acidimicrobiales bacterium]